MKKIILYPIFVIALLFTSCKSDSLQSYLVESQQRKEFITLDLPGSIVNFKTDEVSEDDRLARESIRKINITALPIDRIDQNGYEFEKNKIKQILKKSNYKKLMNFKRNGVNAVLYYTGDADAIDELIAFGYGEEYGLGLARVFGNNMNPNKIMKMLENAKFNKDDVDFNQFKTFFD